MKNVETKKYTTSQKQIIVGNRVRNIIIIDRKSKVDSSNNVKTVSHKITTVKKKCRGCSRKRRV